MPIVREVCNVCEVVIVYVLVILYYTEVVSLSPPGMNLQICFMNETVSDTESPSSDTETTSSPVKSDPDKPAVVSRGSTLPVKV